MAARVYRDQLRKKRRNKFLFKLFLVTGLVFLFLTGAVYALFFAGLLDLRAIDVSGEEIIPPAELKNAAEGWLGAEFLGISVRQNLFFVSSKKLALELTAKFPRIDSVEIKKKLPHGLEIIIAERQSAGIWCLIASNGCFYFDKNGVAYAEAAQSSGFLILNVADYRDREVALGSPIASEEWFKNILSARELLPKVGVNVAEFTVPSGSFDEFDARTAEGWKIMFSNSTDVAKQISSLKVFFRDELPAGKRTGLQYIDLRIQDRIYYK
jgi:cell division septal protein FtsQ